MSGIDSSAAEGLTERTKVQYRSPTASFRFKVLAVRRLPRRKRHEDTTWLLTPRSASWVASAVESIGGELARDDGRRVRRSVWSGRRPAQVLEPGNGGNEMTGTTYNAIQKFVQRRHGFVPTSGWITHVKAVSGLPTRRAANRAARGRRVVPCPADKREAIEEALRHFRLI
jgi:hypothetical protein